MSAGKDRRSEEVTTQQGQRRREQRRPGTLRCFLPASKSKIILLNGHSAYYKSADTVVPDDHHLESPHECDKSETEMSSCASKKVCLHYGNPCTG